MPGLFLFRAILAAAKEDEEELWDGFMTKVEDELLTEDAAQVCESLCKEALQKWIQNGNLEVADSTQGPGGAERPLGFLTIAQVVASLTHELSTGSSSNHHSLRP